MTDTYGRTRQKTNNPRDELIWGCPPKGVTPLLFPTLNKEQNSSYLQLKG